MTPFRRAPDRPARAGIELLALVALPLLWVAAACSDATSTPAGWEASVDTIADTVVVRTVAGSAWPDTMVMMLEIEIGVLDGAPEYMFGNVSGILVDAADRIWTLDRQVPEIRVFDPQGTYVMTVGRPGEGPGELGRPDGGFTPLSDGRVLVRDPANGRIQVYGADGGALDTWIVRGNFSTSNPLWKDRDDNVYTQVLLDPEASLADWQMGLAKIAPDGTSSDTLAVPDAHFETPFIEARSENSWSRNSVPFSASEDWALHPDGYFVHGIGDAYSFTLLRNVEEHGAMPLRIERQHQPVAVAAGEKAEEKARATRNMRGMIPDWKWNGPEIPDVKPAFRNLLVGQDGRIWVQVSAPGYERDDPDYDPTDPDAVEDRWKEPTVFDVFEPDGRYLGHVKAPEGFSSYPTPVLRGDRVWAVVRDDLGVERIVRFRLQPEDRP